MKKLLVLLVVFGFFSQDEVFAQNKLQGTFKMPNNVRYTRGRVLVKIKSEFKDEIASISTNKSGVLLKNILMNSISPMVKPELARYGAMRNGARAQKPVVDISKYYALTFDVGQDVEEYINKLYATGYFEI